MWSMPRRPALLAVLLLGAAACGKSREAKAFDELGQECGALVANGATIRDADSLFGGAYVFLSPSCDPALPPLGSADACGTPEAGDARCEMFWYFVPSDPGLCGPNGCCYICEARALQSAVAKSGIDTPICASQFHRKQPCI